MRCFSIRHKSSITHSTSQTCQACLVYTQLKHYSQDVDQLMQQVSKQEKYSLLQEMLGWEQRTYQVSSNHLSHLGSILSMSCWKGQGFLYKDSFKCAVQERHEGLRARK
jgi:hypothetical protein